MRYVEGGGTLLVTVRSGMKDEHNRVVFQPLPGLLAPLLGVTVREFSSLPAGQQYSLTVRESWGGLELVGDTWAEQLEPEAAEVVATYADGLFAGQAAITWRQAGEGGAMYLGVMGAQPTAYILDALLARTKVRPPVEVDAPRDIEVAVREGDGRRLVFLMNYSDQPRAARFAAGETVELEPYGVRVLKQRMGERG